MPTVSTQVVADAAPQTFSAEYVQNLSTVDQYKNIMTQIRLQRTGIASQMQTLMDDMATMQASRQGLVDQFHIKAFQMYPQYAGQDLKVIIQSLSKDHPLVQLWLSSSQTINDVRNALVAKAMVLQALMNQELTLEDQETQTLASYDAFSTAAQTAVPTTAQLIAGLVQVSVIPVASETSVIASIPAIESLDPEAAAAVTLQVVQALDQTPVDLAVSVQATPPPVVQPSLLTAISNLHPVIKYGGAAAIAMLIFGKK